METIKTVFYWVSYAYYLYVFGYASLFKVFQKKSMMDSMLSLGFNKTWTILIGIAELIGVILIVAGLIKPQLRNMGILLLIPFSVGAFTAHMAHQEYQHYYNSLIVCILTVVMLVLDNNFKIQL